MKLKRGLSLAMAAIVLSSGVFNGQTGNGGFLASPILSVCAESGKLANGLEYETANGMATITNYTGTSETLKIPAMIVGCQVTSIGAAVFRDCTELTSVTFPETLKTIEDNAFMGCTGLKTVTLSKSVVSVGAYAFSHCTGLTEMRFGNSTESIGTLAFFECSSLKTLVMPYGLTSIEDDAFKNVTGVTVYGNRGSAAENFATQKGYKYVAMWEMYKDTLENGLSYKTVNGEAIITECDRSVTGSIVIPESIDGYPVTAIDEFAFSLCEKLEKVTIPDSVTTIGKMAFGYCSSLISITFPSNLLTIGEKAFLDCVGLKSVSVPNSVINVGAGAFSGCTGLVSASLSDNLISVESRTFSGCTEITSIWIPENVVSIGAAAFFDCTSLDYIELGNKVTSIGNHAFRNCSSLLSISLPFSVKTIGDEAFSNCTQLNAIAFFNNEVEFGQTVFTNSPNIAFFGNKGSTAEEYASARKISFFLPGESVFNVVFDSKKEISNKFYYSYEKEFNLNGMEIYADIYQTVLSDKYFESDRLATVNVTADCKSVSNPHDLYWSASTKSFEHSLEIVYNYSAKGLKTEYEQALKNSNSRNAVEYSVLIGQKGDANLDHSVGTFDAQSVLQFYSDVNMSKTPIMSEDDNEFACFLANTTAVDYSVSLNDDIGTFDAQGILDYYTYYNMSPGSSVAEENRDSYWNK